MLHAIIPDKPWFPDHTEFWSHETERETDRNRNRAESRNEKKQNCENRRTLHVAAAHRLLNVSRNQQQNSRLVIAFPNPLRINFRGATNKLRDRFHQVSQLWLECFCVHPGTASCGSRFTFPTGKVASCLSGNELFWVSPKCCQGI